jgi:tetratricopeptide (TPR) repeat protein
MSLSEFRSRRRARATQRFTDREEPQETFRRHLERLDADPNYFCVVTYYGVGGIGKSSLLRHLQQNLDGERFASVFVDLETASYSSFLDILLDVHRQLPFSCPLFEYAVAKYCVQSNRSLTSIKRTMLRDDSLLFDLQEVAADMAEVVAPVRLLKRLAEQAYDRFRRIMPDIRDEIAEIDEIGSLADLEIALPSYLGLEIRRNLKPEKRRLVVFVDSHEVSMRRDVFASTKRNGDAWLTEMAGTAEMGVFAIAGRESLKWDASQPAWAERLDQHMLGSLTDADADTFLRTVGVEENEVRDAIVASSNGVPLYLDLCADTYAMRRRAGEPITRADFRLTENRVIDRFLKHLPQEKAAALRVLSIPEVFDRGLFDAILRELNIGLPSTYFLEFCDGSYAEELRADDGVFKIHQIVRDYLRDEADDYTLAQVAAAILSSAESSAQADDHRRGVWVFEQFLALAPALHRLIAPATTERCLKIGLWLIDRGHWHRLFAVVRSAAGTDDLVVALGFLQAVCARKLGDLRKADALYESIAHRTAALQDYRFLVAYHSAHVVHLLGDFGRAEERYAALAESAPAGPIQQEAALLARRQLADVTMIRGGFRSALQGFEALRGADEDPLWRAEVCRFRGHVHRFNAQFAAAEPLYRQAEQLAASVKADAMLGKAMTNLAETFCWTAPETALDMARDALELNRQVGAPIEEGKALAARAVAEAMLGRTEAAVATARTAADLHLASGYRHGTLFAMQAEGLAYLGARERARAMQIAERMDALAREISVYGFLSLILWQDLAPDEALPRYGAFEWLEPEAIVRRHRTLVDTARAAETPGGHRPEP